jgi:hypothetical protein
VNDGAAVELVLLDEIAGLHEASDLADDEREQDGAGRRPMHLRYRRLESLKI